MHHSHHRCSSSQTATSRRSRNMATRLILCCNEWVSSWKTEVAPSVHAFISFIYEKERDHTSMRMMFARSCQRGAVDLGTNTFQNARWLDCVHGDWVFSALAHLNHVSRPYTLTIRTFFTMATRFTTTVCKDLLHRCQGSCNSNNNHRRSMMGHYCIFPIISWNTPLVLSAGYAYSKQLVRNSNSQSCMCTKCIACPFYSNK